jgi:hypothetical protein
VEHTKTKKFWDPESRMKVITFAHMRKAVPTKSTDKFMVDSEVLFRRLLVVSKKRDVSLETVLEHELATVPPALFHDDGSMRKTVKSDLAKKLEASCEEVHSLSSGVTTAYVIDGMALLQCLKESQFTTFDELGSQVMQYIASLLKGDLGVVAVTIVFDRYDNQLSIKHIERQRRGSETGSTYVINGSRTVPNYRTFMNNSANKAALAAFTSDYIVS